MGNFSISWSYKQFKSEDDARIFCTSDEFDSYVSSLEGVAYSLYEQGLTEPKVSQGHGHPAESNSSMESAYCNSEADRLREMGRYFRGEKPRPGYVWVYSTHGLHSVSQKIDISNLTPKHPVFLDYIKGQNLNRKERSEAYSLWKSQFDDNANSIDIFFKLTYNFKIKDLIPNNIKLLNQRKRND
jgi:hypothetical protein